MMHTLRLQRKILLFTASASPEAQHAKLSELRHFAGVRVDNLNESDTPQLVALKMAHAGGPDLESYIDEKAGPGLDQSVEARQGWTFTY